MKDAERISPGFDSGRTAARDRCPHNPRAELSAMRLSSPDFMCPFLIRSGGLVEVGLVPDAGGYDCTA